MPTRKLLLAGRWNFCKELLLSLQIGEQNGDLGPRLYDAGVIFPQHDFHLMRNGGYLGLYQSEIFLLLLERAEAFADVRVDDCQRRHFLPLQSLA